MSDFTSDKAHLPYHIVPTYSFPTNVPVNIKKQRRPFILQTKQAAFIYYLAQQQYIIIIIMSSLSKTISLLAAAVAVAGGPSTAAAQRGGGRARSFLFSEKKSNDRALRSDSTAVTEVSSIVNGTSTGGPRSYIYGVLDIGGKPISRKLRRNSHHSNNCADSSSLYV